jgi:2-methylisocitrate lyase-like PEP mutase family enzyme
VRLIPRILSVPQILNVVVSGKMPIVDRAAATAIGLNLVLCANTALHGAVQGMQAAAAVPARQRLIGRGGSSYRTVRRVSA